jgi:hypothetical protein
VFFHAFRYQFIIHPFSRITPSGQLTKRK